MKIITVNNYSELSKLAAELVAKQLKKNPNSVLGLPTGSTPIGTYEELIKMNRSGEVDFSNVVSFNLDEYCGLSRDNSQSYYYFMMENLFSGVNINRENIHILNGMAENYNEECEKYELNIEEMGGIDLQLLGVGHNGHIGFNEPDEVFYNRTREVKLTQSTIEANKRFFKNADAVPKTALSMGIGTIMKAKEIILIAGADKKNAIKMLQEDVVSPQLPVSILNYHPNCTVILAQN